MQPIPSYFLTPSSAVSNTDGDLPLENKVSASSSRIEIKSLIHSSNKRPNDMPLKKRHYHTMEAGQTHDASFPSSAFFPSSQKKAKYSTEKPEEETVGDVQKISIPDQRIKCGYGEMRLKDGSIYRGDFLHYQFHGEGVLAYVNGAVYKGTFFEGKPHGSGELIFSKCTYKGDFVLGKMTGKGIFKYENGCEFEGRVVNGVRQRGTLTYRNGTIYSGEFKGDEPNGQGTITYSSKVVYEGNVKGIELIKYGEGKLIYSDLTIYKGLFENDRPAKKGYLSFPDGSSYEGDCRNGKPHGAGLLTLFNDHKLSGNFYEGVFLGEGRLEMGDREIIGIFHGNQCPAKGLVVFPNGDTYEGDLLNGKMHGVGTFTSKKMSLSYKGQFKEDVFHGDGLLIYPNGESYQGAFVEGKRCGKGTLEKKGTYPCTYIGLFEDDQIKGQGLLSYANQDWFEGIFDEKGLQGFGRCCINKSNYTGGFLNGLKHGLGKEVLSNGTIYDGTFESNYFVKGKVSWPNGMFYEGTFQNGVFDGEGVLQLTDYKYEGTFFKGLKHGQGTLSSSDGRKYEGEFKEDVFHSGVLSYPNGNSYQGEYLDFQASGQGTLTLANKDVFIGEFKEDKPCGKGTYRSIHGFVIEGNVSYPSI